MAVLLCLVSSLAGCEMIGFISYIFAGPPTKTIEAQYDDMEGRTVAVLVSLDTDMSYLNPGADEALSRDIAGRLDEMIDKARVVNPRVIMEFKEANRDWEVIGFSRIAKALHAERLVVVELLDYQSHDPGNRHVWKGAAVARVGIVEADGDDPDNFVNQYNVNVRYPGDSFVGAIEPEEEQIMRDGLSYELAVGVVRLFHKHNVYINEVDK